MPVTNKDLETVFSRYPTITVPCSLGPIRKGRSFGLNLTARLELHPYPVLPETAGRSKQYMGIHKCLFFTYQHPPILSSLIRMASTIHTIQPWGPVTWLGRTDVRPPNSHGGGYGLTWPASLWVPPAPYRTKRTTFKCLVHPVRLSYNWKIVVIELPLFPRELFDAFLNSDLPLET